MDFPDDHPLVRHLWPLGPDAPPDERIRATLRAFEEATGKRVGSPLDNGDRQGVREWLMSEEDAIEDTQGRGYALMSMRQPVTRALIFPDAANKASHLHQSPCLTCMRDLTRSPLSVSFAVHVRPFSAQSLDSPDLAVLKAKIAASMEGRFEGIDNWSGSPLCVRVVAVVSRSDRPKDIDNMVKGLLDSLQGSMYTNDTSIVHLSVDRFRHAGDDGYYVLSIRPVLDPLGDVIDPESRVGWRTNQAMIEI